MNGKYQVSSLHWKKKLLELECHSLTWTVSSEDLLKMKLVQTDPVVQEPDKVITHHYININPPFLFSRCSQMTAWKNAIHSGLFYNPVPPAPPLHFSFSFKNVSNELIKTCLWQTVNWILKLMSALETATIFCQNLYPSMDSNILWRLCLQTQISNEAYIMHFNLQHCLNQALLVISLWENPCQLLLLQKKLVAGKIKWNPQSYSQ